MRRTLLRAVVASSSITGALAMAAEHADASESGPAGKHGTVLLTKHLARLGDTFDIHFTIEEAWEVGETSNYISSRWISVSSDSSGPIADKLRELQSLLPSAVIEVSKSNTKIVHMKNKRLVGLKGYSLDVRIEDIHFKGTPYDLLSVLKREVPGFLGLQSIPIGGDRFVLDAVTVIHIDARQAVVRDLLSNYLPLEKYKRVLWRSETRITPPATTEVFFRGPRRRRHDGTPIDPPKTGPSDGEHSGTGASVVSSQHRQLPPSATRGEARREDTFGTERLDASHWDPEGEGVSGAERQAAGTRRTWTLVAGGAASATLLAAAAWLLIRKKPYRGP